MSSRSPPWERRTFAARQLAHGMSSLALRGVRLRAPGAGVYPHQLVTAAETRRREHGRLSCRGAQPTCQLAEVTPGRTDDGTNNRYCAALLRWPGPSSDHLPTVMGAATRPNFACSASQMRRT